MKHLKNQKVAHQNISVISSPDSNGSSVQLQLTVKFPPVKKNSMRPKIKAILHQMLKDNMASWNAVPTSIKLTGILLFCVIFYYLSMQTINKKKKKKGLEKKKEPKFLGIFLGKISFPNCDPSTIEMVL